MIPDGYFDVRKSYEVDNCRNVSVFVYCINIWKQLIDHIFLLDAVFLARLSIAPFINQIQKRFIEFFTFVLCQLRFQLIFDNIADQRMKCDLCF